jgi:hypothetical protein
LWHREVEGKARGSGAGSGAGGEIRVDVRVGWNEPVRWIGLVEGSVAGGDGSVFVARLGPSVGTEGGDAGRYGVLWVAVLVKEMEGGEGEGCGDNQGQGYGWKGFELQGCERKGQGEAHGCGQNGEESPGELEEGQVGNVLPDGVREGGEEKGYGYGENGQAIDKFFGDMVFGGKRMSGSGCNGDDGDGKKDDGDDGRGFEDSVVDRVDGVVEEEVVLDTGSGCKDLAICT